MIVKAWNAKLAEIWLLLTESPETFKGGDIWQIIIKIHGALQAIGLALLVLFFLWGMIRTCTNWQDIKRPEQAFKLFLRFIIARALVMYGMELMTSILKIVQRIIQAITESVGLGIAHSMAHTLGAVYDTPHGVACAMMLPIVMEYNADCTGEKYREIARAMGVKGVDDMSVEEYRKAAIDAVAQLSVDVGIPTKLEAIKEDDLDFLAESAHADACAPGNPKDASVEDLKALFRKIM